MCNGIPIFIKREQTIEKIPNFVKTILITCTNHRQSFSASACFLLKLLGHQCLLLYLLLYFYAVLRTLIKMEYTIEKSPKFQQKFNDVASFVLELLGFDFYICTIFLCSFSKNNKNGTNN